MGNIADINSLLRIIEADPHMVTAAAILRDNSLDEVERALCPIDISGFFPGVKTKERARRYFAFAGDLENTSFTFRRSRFHIGGDKSPEFRSFLENMGLDYYCTNHLIGWPSRCGRSDTEFTLYATTRDAVVDSLKRLIMRKKEIAIENSVSSCEPARPTVLEARSGIITPPRERPFDIINNPASRLMWRRLGRPAIT